MRGCWNPLAQKGAWTVGGTAKVRLQVQGLEVAYRTPHGRHVAVQDIDLEVREGEKVILLGPSGCGKSTLLKAIAAFEQPSRGRILLDGKEVTKPGFDRAVLFQEFDQLFPWKTVIENVAYALRVTGRCGPAEARDQALVYLRMVGLDRYAHFYPHHLSGGMKMRVAIARSLAVRPQVLLMDEPFAALDNQTRSVLQAEVNRIQAETGKTLIFVTHSVEEALVIGHRIVVMTTGPGRILEIIDNPVAGAAAALETPVAAELYRRIRLLLQPPASAQKGGDAA